MKTIIIIVVVLAIATLLYFATGSPGELEVDAEIDKFARVQTALAIETEHYFHDDSLLAPIRDSILNHYEVSEEWLSKIENRIDKHPGGWVKVYDKMIEHAERVKDSLTRQRRPADDSISTHSPDHDK